MPMIDRILDDISRWNERLIEIVPVNYGEFFMRQDWYTILLHITQKLPATQIVIPTNGSFFTDETIRRLCFIPTVKIINFSVNAYFDETYETFTGLSSTNIQRIRKGIAEIRILRPDIFLVTSMVFDPEYQTDLERDEFIIYWSQWAKVEIIPAASAGRAGKKPYNPVKIPCRSIFSDIVIGYDGKISSCCWDANFHLDLGFYNGNLLDNWRGKELTNLRQLHNEGKRTEVDLCRACTFS